MPDGTLALEPLKIDPELHYFAFELDAAIKIAHQETLKAYKDAIDLLVGAQFSADALADAILDKTINGNGGIPSPLDDFYGTSPLADGGLIKGMEYDLIAEDETDSMVLKGDDDVL